VSRHANASRRDPSPATSGRVSAQPGGLPAEGGVPATPAPARGKAFPPQMPRRSSS